YKIINENPTPPRELDASIHAGLSYVISKALAKNSDERYQTCSELAEDLRNYKNLGGAATGQGTVILTAPSVTMEMAEPVPPPPARTQRLPPPRPSAPRPPAPTALDETPIGNSYNAQ